MLRKPNRFAARVSLTYFGVAFLWILFSDRAVDLLPERWQISELQTLKGWFFVASTALLLYLYLRRSLTRQQRESDERERVADNIRKLSHAVDQSPVSVVITNIEGKIEYVNRKFSLVTGYTSEEVLGKDPRMLKSAEMPEELHQEIWNTLRSGGTWSGELHQRKKSGELFWEWVDVSPVVNVDGKISHFVAVKEDFTERKKIAEALSESESRFRQLAETIDDVFWIIGPAPDKLLYVSPAYEKVWGRSLESLYKNPYSWLEAVHPEGTRNESKRVSRPHCPPECSTSGSALCVRTALCDGSMIPRLPPATVKEMSNAFSALRGTSPRAANSRSSCARPKKWKRSGNWPAAWPMTSTTCCP